MNAEKLVLLLFVEMRERLLAGWSSSAVGICRRHNDIFDDCKIVDDVRESDGLKKSSN
jgi:hypothetical protein